MTMMRSHVMIYVSAAVFVLVTHSTFSFLGGPSAFAAAAADSEEPTFAAMHDLYDLLLQRAALEERLGDSAGRSDGLVHQVVRKSNRSPSLRLRFGRRADPSLETAMVEAGTQGADAGTADSKNAWPNQPRVHSLFP